MSASVIEATLTAITVLAPVVKQAVDYLLGGTDEPPKVPSIVKAELAVQRARLRSKGVTG